MSERSALYEGVVVHRRHRPVKHWLRYRMVSLLLDLDELDALSKRLRCFSLDRFNIVSFARRDHGDGGGDLRGYVDRQLGAAGLAPAASVQLLCMPRVLGFAFNPLCVYVCRRADGEIDALLYEVNNTFGQRHSYLIAAAPDGWRRIGGDAARTIAQACPKAFYVSPFMDMDLTYRFRVTPPGETVSIAIDVMDDEGIVLGAALAGRRERLSDATLLRAVLLHAPLLPLRVVLGIHWEALKLWVKGMRVRPRPPAPAMPVSILTHGAAIAKTELGIEV